MRQFFAPSARFFFEVKAIESTISACFKLKQELGSYALMGRDLDRYNSDLQLRGPFLCHFFPALVACFCFKLLLWLLFLGGNLLVQLCLFLLYTSG